MLLVEYIVSCTNQLETSRAKPGLNAAAVSLQKVTIFSHGNCNEDDKGVSQKYVDSPDVRN